LEEIGESGEGQKGRGMAALLAACRLAVFSLLWTNTVNQ
jgi:hypothetical protein